MPSLHCLLALLLLALPRAGAAAGAQTTPDLREVDLAGDWYVLIHYKDDTSPDASITKFLDLAWSVKRDEGRLEWTRYPYVRFEDAVEEVRRQAMTRHLPWEPDEATWKRLRETLDVSPRATSRKTLHGSVEKGFASGDPARSGGVHLLTFSRHWEVTFARSLIRIAITDSLSGSAGLAPMSATTLFEIDQVRGPGELAGRWREGTRHGTFRMLRAREHRVLE